MSDSVYSSFDVRSQSNQSVQNVSALLSHTGGDFNKQESNNKTIKNEIETKIVDDEFKTKNEDDEFKTENEDDEFKMQTTENEIRTKTAGDQIEKATLTKEIPEIEFDPSTDLNNNVSIKAQLSCLSKLIRKQIVDGKNNVEILRNDPKSPLYSVKSFQELYIPDNLLKGIYALNFQKPSKIQETILPMLMARPYRNCIAQSQSGTGKTAAFLIASLKRVDTKEDYPQVLIICPTLELARQTADVARKMSKFTDIKVRNIVKGEFCAKSALVEHVLIGTPGKVLDWGLRFKSFDLKKIKVFVLDEADIMIDIQGHRQQSIKTQAGLDENCQHLLFSATYRKDVLEFAECIIRDPIMVTLRREDEALDNVVQFYAHCNDEEEKYVALANIFGNVVIGQTIIFVQTKKSANFLKDKLEKDGHVIALLTGELTVDERMEVIGRFRKGEERVMITTNVASRGLDIDQVTLVINYDLPFDVFNKDVDFDVYLHRIGRAGRFGKPGFAVSLIDANKAVQFEQIKKLEDHFMKPIALLKTYESEQFKGWN